MGLCGVLGSRYTLLARGFACSIATLHWVLIHGVVSECVMHLHCIAWRVAKSSNQSVHGFSDLSADHCS